MKNTRTRIAAAATVLGLGGLTGVALNAGGQSASKLADKPIVHTRVIRRTIHVTKHRKPKRPVGAGSPAYTASGGGSPAARSGAYTGGGAVTTGSSSSGASTYVPPEPVTTATSGAASPAPEAEYEPVTTATSGSGAAGSGGSEGASGESEHESEGGFDD